MNPMREPFPPALDGPMNAGFFVSGAPLPAPMDSENEW
jgi:hypothetical protein